jgi:OOP family OmpA-OmpF porin
MKCELANTLATLGLVGLAAVVSPCAVAEDDAAWYVGGNIGKSRASFDDARIRNGLLGAGFATTSISDNDRDTGFKVFGGYQFNRYFALEGGYFSLGKFSSTATTVPSGTLRGEIKVTGFNLDAVGMLPMTEEFYAFARAGVIDADAKDNFTGTGAVTVLNSSPSKRAVSYKAGLGLGYDFVRAFGLRLEVERYRVDDAVGNKGDIDLLSVGFVYRFGTEAAAVIPAPAAAAIVAPPPAAAPVVIVVPVEPATQTQRYCSILDVQFEINKNTVQRESEEKIDKVAIFMRKYPNTTAVIEGHTDEVGTTADNVALSQRRADSVVSYLADHGGIARSRLKAVGYGESRPIADNRTEEGKRLNRRVDAIIACATDIEGLTPSPVRITMAMEMEFEVNRSEVRPQYTEELRKVANFMKANPTVTATVEGHASNHSGSPEQAMQISKRRAESVVDALSTQFGVARSRLNASGFGETRRFAYNTSAEGQQENRRVNIILVFPK